MPKEFQWLPFRSDQIRHILLHNPALGEVFCTSCKNVIHYINMVTEWTSCIYMYLFPCLNSLSGRIDLHIGRKWRSHWKTNNSSREWMKYRRGSQRNLKSTTSMLAKASSELLLCSAVRPVSRSLWNPVLSFHKPDSLCGMIDRSTVTTEWRGPQFTTFDSCAAQQFENTSSQNGSLNMTDKSCLPVILSCFCV